MFKNQGLKTLVQHARAYESKTVRDEKYLITIHWKGEKLRCIHEQMVTIFPKEIFFRLLFFVFWSWYISYLEVCSPFLLGIHTTLYQTVLLIWWGVFYIQDYVQLISVLQTRRLFVYRNIKINPIIACHFCIGISFTYMKYFDFCLCVHCFITNKLIYSGFSLVNRMFTFNVGAQMYLKGHGNNFSNIT